MIDTVHRVGMKKLNYTRGVIIQFSSRTLRAAVWAAAKKSAYLREKGLRFREDLCKTDRESKMKLWPLVDEARKVGKMPIFFSRSCFRGEKGDFSIRLIDLIFEIRFPVYAHIYIYFL